MKGRVFHLMILKIELCIDFSQASTLRVVSMIFASGNFSRSSSMNSMQGMSSIACQVISSATHDTGSDLGTLDGRQTV